MSTTSFQESYSHHLTANNHSNLSVCSAQYDMPTRLRPKGIDFHNRVWTARDFEKGAIHWNSPAAGA
ncbi:hypothetical protein Spb1_10090 [Planctopirus ephydatiae]|uniref:Uncharacterized protein n=1 Tax=Planctopirus ephydatiae TaxID=2528019 RepID=A0A518GKJ7_9PLAN|nr:hypothetical protein Spb1_10090 [Planctopirus ephydatiae]